MPSPAQQQRLRHDRYSESGRLYLVTTVTANREKLFADWRAGRLVVGELRTAHDAGWARAIAWVVMPDHIHWLFELGDMALSTLLQRTKSCSAIAVNRYLRRKGPVWQSGFYDHALRREEDLRRLARYVVANPLRAGLVRSLRDYPLWDAQWL